MATQRIPSAAAAAAATSEANGVTLTKSGTGYSSTVALTDLGTAGVLALVQLRLDATLDEGSTAILVISTSSTISAATIDEDIVYESDSFGMVGSATIASLIDNLYLTGRAVYTAALYVALNVTVAGGGGASTSVEVKVTAVGG
jgi:hypothetical protein